MSELSELAQKATEFDYTSHVLNLHFWNSHGIKIIKSPRGWGVFDSANRNRAIFSSFSYAACVEYILLKVIPTPAPPLNPLSKG